MALENWAIYAILAMFAFGVGNFIIKVVADRVALPVIMLFFYVFAVVIGGVYYYANGAPSFPISHALLAMAGGSLFAIGLIFASQALNIGEAVRVVPLFNLNTLITVLLAIAILGEKLNLRIVSGIVFAVISVYLLAG